MIEFFNIFEIIGHPGVYLEYHFWPNSSPEYKFTKELVVDNDGNVWHNNDLYTEEDICMISDFQDNHGNYKYILKGSCEVNETIEEFNTELPF